MLADCLPGEMNVEALNLQQPQKVQSLYASFLSAGAQLLVSHTFCCDPDSLRPLAQQKNSSIHTLRQEICQAAVGHMRQAIQQCFDASEPVSMTNSSKTASNPPYIVGAIGPGWKSPSRGEISLKTLQADYADWAESLLQTGVDALYLETVRDPRQAEAAVLGILQAQQSCGIKCPIAVFVTLSEDGLKIGDFDFSSALNAILQLPIQAAGVNCSFGPTGIEPVFEYFSTSTSLPLLCAPNAGLPDAYLSPEAFVQAFESLICKYPLAEVRGCCGTEVAHIQKLKESLPAFKNQA